ncbi:MAG: DUF4124 domain-containing protein [Proteobacteria bacterium]|nr:DUF4124 domain-containing protein [Pseudomonadota bacterium]
MKLLLFTILLGVSFQVGAQTKIYKYTDQEGKVHYSDTKPFADAQEEKLKPIVVIPAKQFDPAPNRRRETHKEKQAKKKFDNFVMASPANEATLSGTGGNVLASVNLEDGLPKNYRIQFYIDGLSHGKVKSKSQLIAGVERGEHSIYAEMIDASTRRVILTTPKTIFFMRQNSIK